MSIDARLLEHYRCQYGTRLVKLGPTDPRTWAAEAHLRGWAIWLIGRGL